MRLEERIREKKQENGGRGEERRDDKIEYRRGEEEEEERRWKWRGGDEKVRREGRSRVEMKEGKKIEKGGESRRDRKREERTVLKQS